VLICLLGWCAVCSTALRIVSEHYARSTLLYEFDLRHVTLCHVFTLTEATD
jgi:hypothetical protein